MNRRIGLLLTLGAIMALVVALSGTVSAAPVCSTTGPVKGQFTQECKEITQREVTVTTATTQPCEVGNSGRMGTQAGTQTQTFLVTEETTTTQVFKGNPRAGKPVGQPTVSTVEVDRELISTGPFTPTENCKNVSGPQ